MNLIIGLFLVLGSHAALAFDVIIKNNMKYKITTGSSLAQSGSLRPGTSIRIPDEFVVRKSSGKFDFAQTLMKWSEEASGEGAAVANAGENFTYFPVQVVKARNQRMVRPGQVVYLQVGNLINQNDPNLKFDDQQDGVTLAEVGKTAAGFKPNICDNCYQEDPQQAIVEFLPKTLSELAELLQHKTENLVGNLDQLNKTFNTNCNDSGQKKTYNDFLEIMKKKTAPDVDLFKLLIPKMALESRGECFSPRNEKDGTKSIGLFQINIDSAHYPVCTAAEIATIKSSTFSQLSKAPRCLENPIVNLEESIRILRDKEAMVFSQGLFDKEGMTSEDKWKLIVASYNGGQLYVLRARQNLIDFVKYQESQGQSVDLDYNKWEDLRIFFFRGALTQGQQLLTYGEYQRRKRSRYNAMSNIAHTEALVDLSEI